MCDTAAAVGAGRDIAAADGRASAVAQATPAPVAVDARRDMYHPDEYWLDVRPAGVSKASAVRGLATYLGVERFVAARERSSRQCAVLLAEDQSWLLRANRNATTAYVDSTTVDPYCYDTTLNPAHDPGSRPTPGVALR